MYRFVFLAVLALGLLACGDDKNPNSYSGSGMGSDFAEISSSSNGNSNGHQNGSGEGTVNGEGLVEGPVLQDSIAGPEIEDIPMVEDSTQVSDVSKMPNCTAANEGEALMVTSENAIYFCNTGEWIPGIVENFGVSCANGNLIAGAEPSLAPPSLFGIDSTGTLVLRREAVAVSGVAEKGPFRYGASVSLVELDSVMRLDPSDRVHRTCITSANGSFSFESVDLVSPYVTVEANGYYRSELTGGMSSDLVTLKAVTDLTLRDSVNVNMFTHLEAPRTLKMVENTGNNRPIREMKVQAFKDILYSFGFVIEGFNESSFAQTNGQNGGFGGFGGFGGGAVSTAPEKTADDVKLFGDGDFSAALLAISIMMQRHGSGEAMMTYADGIADRIRGNGNWDDWGARADLADWLMSLDIKGDFEKIRRNVSSWGQGDAPDFEKYLRKFWTKEFQFPECNASNAGVVTHIGYSQSSLFGCNFQDTSKTKIRFTCDAGLGRWRAATDIEKDTVGLGADTSKYDGAIRPGVINKDKNYVYEAATKQWRAATSDDVMDFSDVADVYNSLAEDESVVFILRHAERTNETGTKGHLTDNGKAQARSVGAKFKNAGKMYFAYSGYTRTLETCEGIATGAGQTATPEVLDGLDGEWYVKSGEPSIEDVSSWAYRGVPAGNFYDLESRSKELVSNYVLANRSKLQKVNFYISHDRMILPLTAYGSQRKVDLRFFDVQGARNWINFLAGTAVIFNSAGAVRYVPVKGLESGTMKL